MRILECGFCGNHFQHDSRPGRPPTTCSDECRKHFAVRRTSEWQKANPERSAKHKASTWAKYYARNREALIRRVVDYQRTHPEKKRAWNSARYARTRGACSTERFTLDEIFERDEALCHLCDGVVERNQATMDHIVPVSLGGPHARVNVALAHRSCNSSRKTMSVDDYRRKVATDG